MNSFPSLHGNWVDFLIFLLLGYYLLSGWRKGLVDGLIDLGTLILSFLLAIRGYTFVGSLIVENFSLSPGIANAIGFFLAGALAQTVLIILTGLLVDNVVSRVKVALIDQNISKAIIRTERFLGLIPAVAEGLIFTAFFLTIFIALPVQGNIKKDILDSRIGGYLVARTQGVEKSLNQIFAPAVSDTISFLTVSPESRGAIDLKFTQTEVSIDPQAEADLFHLVNEERAKAGRSRLAFAEHLRNLARDYGRDMFARGFFSHYNPEGLSPFDRMRQTGISFTAAGENLALAPNVAIAHQGLMNSPTHRANMLSGDFTQVGIGVIDGGIYGKIFVQEFTN